MSQPVRVLYLGPEEMLGLLQEQLGAGYLVTFAIEDAAARRELLDAHYVLDAYMRVRFDAEMLGSATNLRAFVTATTGADHVDQKALEARGLPLLTLRGQPVLRELTPAAELSWLLLMACARKLRAPVEDVLNGVWDRNRHPGLMLKGRTLGIVGCGRIGQWMARYAQAFGMQRIGYDPHLDTWPSEITQRTLPQLLQEADAVTIHVPLNDATRGLIGAREFELMRPGTILVNTSRGEIVDEAALLRALESGKVGAAGLDVLMGEPDVAAHPLRTYAQRHQNLTITPHIGGFSPDAVATVLKFCCQRIRTLEAA
jgi:D-3-phosphoglycerate dehydrogenase